MTQPSYVPIVDADQVRPAYRLRTPADWRQDRVAHSPLGTDPDRHRRLRLDAVLGRSGQDNPAR